MNFKDFVTSLTPENLAEITREFHKLHAKKPVYTFSQLEHKELRKLFKLERLFDQQAFDAWFNADVMLIAEDKHFLSKLLAQETDLIRIYNEEDLKIHFIAPILNRINFKSLENKTRDFYEESLEYETDAFILKGVTDFMVAKGLEYPEKPYFFLQEFKKGVQYSNPEPQLLAELVCAIELNGFTQLKGVFVVGENWNFVILDKLADNQYQYVISRTFNATHSNDLEGIYKILLVVKREIMQAVE
jgi:hypothetical protein